MIKIAADTGHARADQFGVRQIEPYHNDATAWSRSTPLGQTMASMLLLERETQLAALAEYARDACGDAWLRGAVGVWLRRTASPRLPRGAVAEPYQRQLQGDWQRAAQIWTDLGCPWDAALALSDATDETALREALTILNGLGAAAAARITRQKMRLLGLRSIPAGPRTATRNAAASKAARMALAGAAEI